MSRQVAAQLPSQGQTARTVQGVIDLRAYAAGALGSSEWIAGRMAPAFADSDATVAALAPAGQGTVAALRADEFVIVLSGALTLDTRRAATFIGAGRSAVLPAGIGFRWRAPAGTVVLIASSPATVGTSSAVVRIDEAARLEPSSPPAAELLATPTPSCRNHTDYRSANGEFVCGTWDSTPYVRRAMTYRHVELMHLLDGAVTFEDEAGSATFSAGDVVLAVRGAHCAWTSTLRVKKVYAIHRPA